ncbi:hypothetical protein DFR52_102894 [Hoeflea marina]|uniref:Uncharacterized protein n=2 Tax=Hoeflea marina TaxID=274592 RepID=A0A317PN78_9HYPH|nr:hypothetical protein DFR52_102894 [Hoeflea marina]
MTRTFLHSALLALLLALSPLAAHPALAGDCSGAASQVAAQTGGQVLSVSAKSQGGGTVCQVTVLIPGNGNERPKKKTVTVRE